MDDERERGLQQQENREPFQQHIRMAPQRLERYDVEGLDHDRHGVLPGDVSIFYLPGYPGLRCLLIHAASAAFYFLWRRESYGRHDKELQQVRVCL